MGDLVLDLAAAATVFPLEVAAVQSAVVGWSGGGLTALRMGASPLPSLGWVPTTAGLRLLGLSAARTAAQTAARHALVPTIAAAVVPGAADGPEDTTVAEFCGPTLRAVVLADLLTTAVLLPLDAVLLVRHVALATGGGADLVAAPGGGGVVATASAAVATLAVEAGLRWVNVVLTTALADRLAGDIAGPEAPCTPPDAGAV